MTSPSESRLRFDARDALRALPAGERRAFLGLDGFVDEIIHVVDRREDFERYTRLTSIAAYAGRLARAAGKSTNIEWVVQQVKIGGNGPLMAQALGRLGVRVNYVGCVGRETPHPVFEPLSQFGEVLTLADPGHTDAVEFEDGKIMHGKLESIKEVTWARILEVAGGEEGVLRLMRGCGLMALTNWTMVPFSNEIYQNLTRLALAHPEARPRILFFDLADPEKRTVEDLRGILRLLAGFTAQGLHVILGLNHKEALEVAEALGLSGAPAESAADPLRRLTALLREKTGIAEIVTHPRERAAAATREGVWSAEGPFTPSPKLSTGAGDHFNGGYCYGRLLGLEPRLALVVGKATSGFYVRNGIGPTARDMDLFLTQWAEEKLRD